MSVPSHASTRCFQRATFRALALEEQHAAAGGWLQLPGGGEVLLRYVMSSPATAAEAASLRSENATHRDLDALPVRIGGGARVEVVAIGKAAEKGGGELLWTAPLPFAEAPVELMTTATGADGAVKLLVAGDSSVVALA